MAKTPSEIRSLVRTGLKSETATFSMLSVAQMRAHVERICKVNGIEINYGRHASADGKLREIWIRPLKSPRAYATAMHEIGHILGRYQMKRSVMVRERWAWQWARRNALQWTPAMEQYAERRLKSYADAIEAEKARHAKSYAEFAAQLRAARRAAGFRSSTGKRGFETNTRLRAHARSKE
jgi:hypothetical protein